MSSPFTSTAPHDSSLILTPEDHIITPQEMLARTRFKVSPLALHAMRTVRRSYRIEAITIPGARPEYVEATDYNLGLLLELTAGVYQLLPMRNASTEWDKRLRRGQASANEIYRFFCDLYDLLEPFVRVSDIEMDISNVRLIVGQARFALSLHAFEAADALQERFQVVSLADPDESAKVMRCRVALLIDMATATFRFRAVHRELAAVRDRMRANRASVPELLRFFQIDLGTAFNYLPLYG